MTIVSGTDSEAIVAAIETAKSSDREVHFPAGPYHVGAQIFALADTHGLSLTGVPGESKIEINITDPRINDPFGFQIGGASNLIFRNLTFYSTDTPNAAAGAFGGLNGGGAAAPCAFLRILSCEFHHFKDYAWRLQSGSEYLWCIGNYVHHIGTTNQQHIRHSTGISMSYVSHAVYAFNHIEHIDPDRNFVGSRSMYLSDGTVSDVHIQGNTIKNAGAIKIDGQDGGEARRVTIVGNKLTDCVGVGINLAHRVYDTVVRDNVMIISNATQGEGCILVGHEGGPVDNILVVNNIVNCNGYAISGLDINNASHVVIEGNTFFGSPGGGDHAGIRVSGDSDIELKGNHIRDHFDYSIVVERAVSHCSIRDNRISAPKLSGMLVRNSDADVYISANDIDLPVPEGGQGKHAITIDPRSDDQDTGTMILENNRVRGDNFTLVFVREGSQVNVLVRNNLISRKNGAIATQIGVCTQLLDNHYIDQDDLEELACADVVTPNLRVYPGLFRLSLTRNCTIAAPDYGGSPGKTMTMQVFQDGAGSHTVNWDPVFKFPAGVPKSPAPGAFCVFTFRYDGRDWLLTSSAG